MDPDTIIMLDDDDEDYGGGGGGGEERPSGLDKEAFLEWGEDDFLDLIEEGPVAFVSNARANDNPRVGEGRGGEGRSTGEGEGGEAFKVSDETGGRRGGERGEREPREGEGERTSDGGKASGTVLEEGHPEVTATATTPAKGKEEDPRELVTKALQHSVASMTMVVDQLQRQVLQVARVRSTLKRTKSQSSDTLKDRDLGGLSKKQRFLDAARNEAAKRRRTMELVRLFNNILRQLMQHKWAWPFLQPVDVKGLQLHDYYKVIRKPMDLGTIKNRLHAKDGTGYRHVREMCEDVRLVFRNAMLYNESWTDIFKMAKTLSQKFEEKWKSQIEPKLLEEEERSSEDRPERYLSEIAELHAAEEQAAKQFTEEVHSQLQDAERQLEGFIRKLLQNCRRMTEDEKRELGRKFCELPPANLNRALEILSVANVFNPSADRIEVDFEALDQATLWRLHFYLKLLGNARTERGTQNRSAEAECVAAEPSHAA